MLILGLRGKHWTSLAVVLPLSLSPLVSCLPLCLNGILQKQGSPPFSEGANCMQKYRSPAEILVLCLQSLLKDNPQFVYPASRRNEVMGWVQNGVRDFSISRAATQWGIKFPQDPVQTVYVWFDALNGYLSGMLCCAGLSCAGLSCAVLCCAVLCCAVLCCAVAAAIVLATSAVCHQLSFIAVCIHQPMHAFEQSREEDLMVRSPPVQHLVDITCTLCLHRTRSRAITGITSTLQGNAWNTAVQISLQSGQSGQSGLLPPNNRTVATCVLQRCSLTAHIDKEISSSSEKSGDQTPQSCTLSAPAFTTESIAFEYNPWLSTMFSALRSFARGCGAHSRQLAAAWMAGHPYHRQGHSALPCCVLAWHADVLWPAPAPHSLRPWLRHKGAYCVSCYCCPPFHFDLIDLI